MKAQLQHVEYIKPLKIPSPTACPGLLPSTEAKQFFYKVNPGASLAKGGKVFGIDRNVCASNWIPRVLTVDQIQTLYKAMDDLPQFYCFQRENGKGSNLMWRDYHAHRNKLIFMIQYYLALRPKEALSIRWSDILSPKQLYIRAESNKIRRARIADIPQKLYLSLQAFRLRYRRTIRSDFIFPSFMHNRKRPLSRYRWNEIFHSALEIAGYDQRNPNNPKKFMYSCYSLRHSRAVHLLEASNFDIYAVSNILGHRRIDVTMAYLPVCPSFRKHWGELINKNLPF